ncbi:uncharacterized protein LOC130767767 [Actinidia eriantha]|uniref:uncharacterized protein LOC130767767 n=2 Tax=Actinidia eriantha TaxID=165200 RepID=UPI00258C9F8E|nr:uncharacterized protein LOC130767767 [Actinidia eriantha]XP_057480749.1 uncharacterized protein LOC130767767 [Actinidia eriantha]
MDDSGAILCQISSLKDMLDQVNEEIEASIQVTREIESEIVKCSEAESALSIRESELAKMVYMLDFEISGLISVTADSRTSANHLEEDLRCLRMKCDEIVKRVINMRDGFTTSCLDFQRNIDKGQNDVLRDLLLEKEFLENELHLLSKKNNTLQNSMLAFVEEILEDLRGSNSALHVELENGKIENEKLLKDIDELKTTLLSTISI